MRLVNLERVTLADASAHPLEFLGARGERATLSVLEDDMIRVQVFPEGSPRLDRTWTVVGSDGDVPREGRPRDDLSPFSLPEFGRIVSHETIQVRTASLGVTVALEDFALQWVDGLGRGFAADVPRIAYTYDRAGRAVFHYMQRRTDEHYFGFGERSGPLDKAGMRMRMVNLDALGYDAETGDPLYKHFPFYITFLPDMNLAYGVFYDNLASTTFDMGRERDNYYGLYHSYEADDGDIDYTLILGPGIPDVVRKFSALTGRMHLPPRWSLGYLGSTMKYTDADNAQEQLKQFVTLCDEHAIPCDMFHLSSGYTAGADGKRYVFNWNYDRVPDPGEMVRTFHRAGIHLAANIKPCLLTTHPQYASVAEAGGFVQQVECDAPQVNVFWGGDGSHLDFTNPDTYAWWQSQVQGALLRYGIDATWNDNNEFEVWDDDARCCGFGQPVRLGLLRPILTLLMVRASYEAQRAANPDQRPYVLSRSGCPGIQRYAQTWSGDNATSWHTLRYNIPIGLGLSLSGAPNTGHDVGGFAGPKPDPELFVRWVQNGVFHPRFCIHSWNSDGSANEPWMHPEVLPIVRDWINFRYRLIPYLYTLFFEAARTGDPILRPMVYAYPDDPHCHTESFEFMLGPNLLVASVLSPDVRFRAVHLPQGDWYDWYTGFWYTGQRTVEVDAPLERIPLLVPAGGIIPMGRAMRYVGEQPDDVRQVYVFPHPQQGEGAFTLIEDDGVSLGYQRGEFSEVRLSVTSSPAEIILGCRVGGGYPLPYDQLEFILPPGEQRPVRAGEDATTTVDAEGRRHIVVRVG